MHEADGLGVLPPLGLRTQCFLEERDGEIGTARAARRRFGQEDRPEQIRHTKVRVERGGEIEQRVQQVVSGAGIGREPRAAVVLHGANPVEIGEERVVREREPLHRLRGSHVQQTVGSRGERGPTPLADRLEADHAGAEHHEQDERRPPHLKSRLAKIITAAVSSRAT